MFLVYLVDLLLKTLSSLVAVGTAVGNAATFIIL